ncbi:hypothetical protein EBH_0001440 [Eimeria brunetti]|uniref:Uncharacterized protein n=1 Tax=Eimeria brunetti TaxID=51314 RepID=U6LV44_9EIME|nr:hypothetical protein EBH_0001440 [Eimeria brunetti]
MFVGRFSRCLVHNVAPRYAYCDKAVDGANKRLLRESIGIPRRVLGQAIRSSGQVLRGTEVFSDSEPTISCILRVLRVYFGAHKQTPCNVVNFKNSRESLQHNKIVKDLGSNLVEVYRQVLTEIEEKESYTKLYEQHCKNLILCTRKDGANCAETATCSFRISKVREPSRQCGNPVFIFQASESVCWMREKRGGQDADVTCSA